MLGAIESLMSATVADRLSGDRHDPNVELVAQGIANIASPLVGGLPATGAIAPEMGDLLKVAKRILNRRLVGVQSLLRELADEQGGRRRRYVHADSCPRALWVSEVPVNSRARSL